MLFHDTCHSIQAGSKHSDVLYGKAQRQNSVKTKNAPSTLPTILILSTREVVHIYIRFLLLLHFTARDVASFFSEFKTFDKLFFIHEHESKTENDRYTHRPARFLVRSFL